jgi:tetratricopeptide (TPR) repeat protein
VATVHRDAGRYRETLREATTAIAFAREIGHRHLEAEAHIVLASVLLLLRNDNEAERHLRKALSFAQASGARIPETGALLGLAARRRTPICRAVE